jgi:uncharacterized membrane protein YqiK
MSNLTLLLSVIFVIVATLFAISIIFSKLYHRTTKELSFVRTGFGGEKVVMNGGALVLPVLHEIIKVNMNTLRLSVSRAAKQALITKDRMRVDVTAEFFVRVQPNAESIASAAQTLGAKTTNPAALKELVEGKFVDALRSVAAAMEMKELHEKRLHFVQAVQQAVSGDILKNGLELESVSLTALDQTSKEHFNADNAFDAEGLTKLTEEIELRRKRRNEIERETAVAIQQKNLEASKLTLSLTRDEEYAKMEQEREIAIRKADQAAEIAREQAEKEKEAETAKIKAAQSVEAEKIAAERANEEAKITKERAIREKQIEKERVVEAQTIEKQKTVELANQERTIAVSTKSKEQAAAQAAADEARAKAVQAAEKVTTAQEIEVANRHKEIQLIEARKQAESESIAIKVAAEVEKQAAADRAEARITAAKAEADQVVLRAQGEADALRKKAEGEAEAIKLKAEAAERQYEVDAEGRAALNAADNSLSEVQVEYQARLALFKVLPEIIRESVKPLENIDGIKIVQVQGLNPGEGAPLATGVVKNGEAGLVDQIVSAGLRMRAMAPLMDDVMQTAGLGGGSLGDLTQGLHSGSVRKVKKEATEAVD